MRSFLQHLCLTLALGFSLPSLLLAQNDDGRGGHWFLGLNTGGAWQQSDVKAQPGAGWGFYLGKNIYYRPTGFLSWDLRGRYLATTTYGQDLSPTSLTDYAAGTVFQQSFSNLMVNGLGYAPNGRFFHNHRTRFHDLSMELRVNFEALRRSSNIWFSLYGGAGLGIYRTAYDHSGLSFIPTPYDYDRVGLNQSNSGIRSDLLFLRDRDYETFAPRRDGSGGGRNDERFQAGFMPSAGFELGYWFTPRFAMGIGHRVTWTLRDDFDGVVKTSDYRDIHHYANLFMHVALTRSRAREPRPTPPNPNNLNQQPPRVTFTQPATSSTTTTLSPYTVRATVRNVPDRTGIIFTVNGASTANFTYNPNSGVLESTLSLVQGNNTVQIFAQNNAGTDRQQVNIIFQPNNIQPQPQPQPQPQIQPPVVNITSPQQNATLPNDLTSVFASIFNVNNPQEVSFVVNGITSRNFSLNGTAFSASNVRLMQGANNITITATNAGGTASQTVTVFVQGQQMPPPTVRITNPMGNPFRSNTSVVNINAAITNVGDASQVTFLVNGQSVRNFSLRGTTFTANGIALMQGSNSVVITANNGFGTASDQMTIIVQQNVNPNPMPVPPTPVAMPSVRITNPVGNPATASSSTISVNATIMNVNSPGQVSFFVNGQSIRNFSLNGTAFFASNVQLNQGDNTIVITAANNAGTASDQVTVVWRVQRPQPNPQPSPPQPVLAPTVQITNPAANPFTSPSQTTTINAVVNNVQSPNQLTFTVNGRQIQNFSLNGSNFSASGVQLNQGNNSVTLTASNAGGTASDQRTIVWQQVQPQPQPIPAPTVQITNPAANPSAASGRVISIDATVTNVQNSSQLSFTVNGQAIRNFRLNGTRFTANNINLNVGNNTVVLTATTNGGTASDQRTITWQQPQPQPQPQPTPPTPTPTPQPQPQPPTVRISNPATNPFNSSTETTNITAVVTNVDNQGQIAFTVNGQPMRFNFSNGNLTLNNLRLVAGDNNVEIVATTPAGRASDRRTITYVPAQPPTVRITNPAANPHAATSQTINIAANVTNVQNASQVSVTFNGQPLRNFSLNGTNLTANGLSLNQGNNTLVITATNSAGTASDQRTISFKPLPGPIVFFTNPSSSPFNHNQPSFNVTASVSNVSGPNELTFMVNGQTIRNFTLNGINFFAPNVPLNVGNNTLVLSASNAQGQDSKTTIITYQPAVQPPTVRITAPNNPSTTTTPTVNVQATTQNVNAANEVRVSLNGNNYSNFSFSAGSITMRAVPLNAGDNSIVITVQNAGGSNSASVGVTYNAGGGGRTNPGIDRNPQRVDSTTTDRTNPGTDRVNPGRLNPNPNPSPNTNPGRNRTQPQPQPQPSPTPPQPNTGRTNPQPQPQPSPTPPQPNTGRNDGSRPNPNIGRNPQNPDGNMEDRTNNNTNSNRDNLPNRNVTRPTDDGQSGRGGNTNPRRPNTSGTIDQGGGGTGTDGGQPNARPVERTNPRGGSSSGGTESNDGQPSPNRPSGTRGSSNTPNPSPNERWNRNNNQTPQPQPSTRPSPSNNSPQRSGSGEDAPPRGRGRG